MKDLIKLVEQRTKECEKLAKALPCESNDRVLFIQKQEHKWFINLLKQRQTSIDEAVKKFTHCYRTLCRTNNNRF